MVVGVGGLLLPASPVAGWLWDHVSPSAPFVVGAAAAALTAAAVMLVPLGTVREAGRGTEAAA
jgi:hypothetical protein